MKKREICPMCNEIVDFNHRGSLMHRFNYVKWLYINRANFQNKHNVELVVDTAKSTRTMKQNFFEKSGKYSIKITPEQLRETNNMITIQCYVKNNSKNIIYITSMNLLHPSKYFSLKKKQINGCDNETFIGLKPGKSYPYKVQFYTNILCCASYKIPFACDFQMNNENWSVVRTFLVNVDDDSGAKIIKITSPFTKASWKNVSTIVPSTNLETLKIKVLYPIPEEYKYLLLHNLRKPNMNQAEKEILGNIKGILRQHVTEANYEMFWHLLLWMEETIQAIHLKTYNMTKVPIQMGNDVMILEVPGLAEKRPSVIKGDFILIKESADENHTNQTAFQGVIVNVSDKFVEIAFMNSKLIEIITTYKKIVFDVSFVLGRLQYERKHAAIDEIVKSGLVKQLFPQNYIPKRTTIIHDLTDDDFYNKTIVENLEQRQAVFKILNSVQSLPYIVDGPPGTGKSITLIEAILQIKKHTNKKILVCSPANAACDMLTLKLMVHSRRKELLRIHSATRETQSISSDLASYSNIKSGEIVSVHAEKLASYRIIVSTLMLIGRYAQFYSPDCVFIDEAGQAAEPEADVAISLIKTDKQVVLVGDPKQLGPVVSKWSKNYGMGKSLLERLHNEYTSNHALNNADCITMLKCNYRSHEDILQLPNEMFYDNQLKAVSMHPIRDPISSLSIFPLFDGKIEKGRALEFCSVSGKDKKDGASPSFFNASEAKVVVQYIKTLLNYTLIVPTYRVRPDQIGVVTPYKRQVFKINDALKKCGIEGVEVGTTEIYQGREKRIIIISTVRAQHALLKHDKKYDLGFVKEPNRINVALTRAISKVIIVGNPLVLGTDEKWTQIMEHCIKSKSYFGNDLPKRDIAFKEAVVAFKNFNSEDDQYK